MDASALNRTKLSRRKKAKIEASNRRVSYRLSTEPVTVRLPFPPSLDHYYRSTVVGKHSSHYISSEGEAFRRIVIDIWRSVRVTFDGRLAVRVVAVFPNNVPRDLDGLLKALLDSMEHAGVYRNDSQVKLLIVEQSHTEAPGWVDVTIGPKPVDGVQGTLFETAW